MRLTHPDKVVFPGNGITKRQLARVLPRGQGPHPAPRRRPAAEPGALSRRRRGRLLLPEARLARLPRRLQADPHQGEGGQRRLSLHRGCPRPDRCVQMGALELHIWGSHNETLEKPDRIVFDLDPDEDWRSPRSATRRRTCATGSRARPRDLPDGDRRQRHPRRRAAHAAYGWDDTAFSEAMARTMAEEEPKRYLADMSKAKRTGRIFVDYLRNGRGATAICPFSTRARAGALVRAGDVGAARPSDSARFATVENAAELLKKKPIPGRLLRRRPGPAARQAGQVAVALPARLRASSTRYQRVYARLRRAMGAGSGSMRDDPHPNPALFKGRERTTCADPHAIHPARQRRPKSKGPA